MRTGSAPFPQTRRPVAEQTAGRACHSSDNEEAGMPAIVLVGAQWGDEGKGKATDLLSSRLDYVLPSGNGFF